MKFYGQLEKAGLEVLTADPVTNLFTGRVYYNSSLAQLRVYSGSAWSAITGGGGGGGLTPEEKNASFSALSGKNYLVDTSANLVTASLPAGAATASIRFSDAEQTWATYNLTITPSSGQKIMGLSINESLICDVSGAWVQLDWDSVNGWWVPTSNGALNQANVEYASNSGSSTTTSDTTSFVSGSEGTPFIAFSTTGTTPIARRVRFSTPFNPTDEIVLEVRDASSNAWYSQSHSGTPFTFSTNDAGTSFYGAFVGRVAGSTTDLDVNFYQAPFPGGAWNTTRSWRVRKTSGRSVSYPEVVPGVSGGIVSAQGLKGRTDGQLAPTGFVGEVLTFNHTFTSAPNGYSASSLKGTLQPGTYLFQISVGAVAGSLGVAAIYATSGTAGSGLISAHAAGWDSASAIRSPGGNTYNRIGGTLNVRNLSAPENVYLQIYNYHATAITYEVQLTAVRIA